MNTKKILLKEIHTAFYIEHYSILYRNTPNTSILQQIDHVFLGYNILS